MDPPEAEQQAEVKPRRTTRRRFLKTAVAGAVAGTTVAAYARYVEPIWVEVTHHDLPVPNLPSAWEGARIAHLSDFHLCPWVPEAYLARCIKQTADLAPDLVVVTGDFITIGQEEYGPRAARLLTDLDSPFGTFACLGNHEYGLKQPKPHPVRPSTVTGALEEAGVRVLNNASERITREGGDLWIAGVEDLWSARYDPAQAMANVPRDAASLILCHNPDAAEDLDAAGCGTILAGHTHGGQVQIPFWGPLILPVRNTQRYEGLHRVGGTWLYINRGLGWLWRIRFACRPEITVHTLRSCARPSDYGAASKRSG